MASVAHRKYNLWIVGGGSEQCARIPKLRSKPDVGAVMFGGVPP